MISSIFGFSSHLSLEGPAARAVLARARQQGGPAALDHEELIAAAEADKAGGEESEE